jgi:hypothetical protein
MEGWKPLAELNVFVPPTPTPVIHQTQTSEQEEGILCGEEARHIYRLAYYQRRVNQALLILLLSGLLVPIVEVFSQSNIVLGIIVMPFVPFWIYGAYCFVRLNMEIYPWWASIFSCLLSFVFFPFLIINAIIFSIKLRKIYRESGIPTSTFGVSPQTLKELKALF